MKIAYLSAQSRYKDKGFTGSPHISYAALKIETYPPKDENSITNFYGTGNIRVLFEALKDVNVVVCFHTYYIDLLEKYYFFDNYMCYEFRVVSIYDIIESEVEDRISLNTLGNALNIHRKVFSGAAYISFWEKGEHEKIKDSMCIDMDITRAVFLHMMDGKNLDIINPKNNKKVSVETSFFKDYVSDIGKKTFNQRMDELVLKIKDHNINNGAGYPYLDVSESYSNYLIDNQRIKVCGEGNQKVLYEPNSFNIGV